MDGIVSTNQKIQERILRLTEMMAKFEIWIGKQDPIECMISRDELTLWLHRVKREWIIDASLSPSPSKDSPNEWVSWQKVSVKYRILAVQMALDFSEAMELERKVHLEDLEDACDYMSAIMSGGL